jgi:hypothetical protein
MLCASGASREKPPIVSGENVVDYCLRPDIISAHPLAK